MSKRSSRRLAVVAGAALAVSSMAPALAAQIDVDGNATVDASSVTLPSADDLVDLVDTGLITDLGDLAFETADDAQALALAEAALLQGEVDGLAGDLLGVVSGLSVGADATANASGGGASLNVSGGAGGTSGVLGLVPDSGDVVDKAFVLADPVVDAAFGMTTTAAGLAQGAPARVFGVAGGLLGTGLDLLDGVSASGEVNVLASLMGSL